MQDKNKFSDLGSKVFKNLCSLGVFDTPEYVQLSTWILDEEDGTWSITETIGGGTEDEFAEIKFCEDKLITIPADKEHGCYYNIPLDKIVYTLVDSSDSESLSIVIKIVDGEDQSLYDFTILLPLGEGE